MSSLGWLVTSEATIFSKKHIITIYETILFDSRLKGVLSCKFTGIGELVPVGSSYVPSPQASKQGEGVKVPKGIELLSKKMRLTAADMSK